VKAELIPRLNAAHFDGRSTNLSSAGIAFDRMIGPSERLKYAPAAVRDSREGFTDCDPDRTTRVAVNPSTPSPKELYRLVKGQRPVGDDVQPEYGLRTDDGEGRVMKTYPRKWTVTDASSSADASTEGATHEGEGLVFVAFDPAGEPVGYSRMDIDMSYFPKDQTSCCGANLVVTYVLPHRRGQGFGVDLSVARSMVCADLLRPVYRAAPNGTTITPEIYSDLHSEGGERMLNTICQAFNKQRSALRYRDGVTVEQCYCDAGF